MCLRDRRILLFELLLDSAVVFFAIWLVGLNPASGLWVMLAFPMIQAVLRLNPKQTAGFFVAITTVYALGELWAASRYEDLTFGVGVVVQQIGVLLTVGLLAANYRHLSSIASTIFNNNLSGERQRERRRIPGDGFAVVYVDVVVDEDLASAVTPELLREVIGRRISACVRHEDQVLTRAHLPANLFQKNLNHQLCQLNFLYFLELNSLLRDLLLES